MWRTIALSAALVAAGAVIGGVAVATTRPRHVEVRARVEGDGLYKSFVFDTGGPADCARFDGVILCAEVIK